MGNCQGGAAGADDAAVAPCSRFQTGGVLHEGLEAFTREYNTWYEILRFLLYPRVWFVSVCSKKVVNLILNQTVRLWLMWMHQRFVETYKLHHFIDWLSAITCLHCDWLAGVTWLSAVDISSSRLHSFSPLTLKAAERLREQFIRPSDLGCRLSALCTDVWCLFYMFVSWLSALRWLAADSIAGGEERNERQRQTEQESGEKYFFLLINRQDLLLLNGVWQDRKWRRTTLNVQSQMEKKQYVIIHVPPNVGFNSGVIWLDSVLSTRWHTLLSPK